MHFDFAAILVSATFLTGVIWAVDSVLFAPKRRLALADSGAVEPKDKPESGRRPGEPLLVEYARSFFPVILIVLVIRSFLAEPFRIHSGLSEDRPILCQLDRGSGVRTARLVGLRLRGGRGLGRTVLRDHRSGHLEAVFFVHLVQPHSERALYLLSA